MVLLLQLILANSLWCKKMVEQLSILEPIRPSIEDIHLLDWFKSIPSSSYYSLLLTSKDFFRYYYPRILCCTEHLYRIPYGGLHASLTLMIAICPPTLRHLFSKPNILFISARAGHLQLIQQAVRYGVDLSIATTRERDTPLHFACACGNDAVVSLLISEGLDTLVKNAGGLMPIHFAAIYRHPSLVALLVNAGADVQALTASFRTPLHYASIPSSDIDSFTESGDEDPINQLSLSFKSMFHRMNAISLLTDLRSPSPTTPLSSSPPVTLPSPRSPHYSSPQQPDELQLALARTLLSVGANPRSPDSRTLSPLHLACMYGPLPLVQLYSEAIAEISRQQELQIEFGDEVSFEGSYDELVRGDELENIERSKEEITPLHFAAGAGHMDIVTYLLSLPSYISSSSPLLSQYQLSHPHIPSPLRLAVEYHHVEVARALVEHGAQVVTNHENNLFISLKGDDKRMFEMLCKHTRVSDSVHDHLIGWAIFNKPEEDALMYVSVLIREGADVNKCDSTLSTPLHMAVAKGYEEVVRVLLEQRADVCAPDKMQRTSLDITLGPWTQEPNMRIVRMLLARDASLINAQDFRGDTILHRAVVARQAEMVAELLSKGARLDIANGRGQTVLELETNGAVSELLQIAVQVGAGFAGVERYS